MPEFTGQPRGEGRRIVVVVSRFNETVTVPLAEGAVAALVDQGVDFDDIDVLWVPGAWEIPVTVRRALATERYDALKAWRSEVAREHNLPAYVIFHDATLASIAERAPQSLDDLQGISGIGAKKLEAYGEEVLRVVTSGAEYTE